MFGHRSFLVLGGDAGDIVSLVKGGYEISDCSFSFQQGVDGSGKATTRVFGGAISLTLSQLPPDDIIEWSLNSRKFKDGAIILLNSENIPIEKVLFSNANCIAMDLDFSQSGNSYASTKLTINAEKIIVGNGIPFENEWNF